MGTYYNPKRIVEVRNQLTEISDIISEEYQLDETLIDSWICSLEKMNPKQSEIYGKWLSEEDVSLIAEYLSKREEPSRLSAGKKWMIEYATKKDWECLFLGWQDRYHNEELKRILLDGIKDADAMKEVLNKYEIKKRNVEELLEKGLHHQIIKKIDSITSEEHFRTFLKECGVVGGTKLQFANIRRLYCICNASVYENSTDDILSDAYGKFSHEEQIAFIMNLLKKCDMEVLERFQRLFELIKTDYIEETDAELEVVLIMNKLKSVLTCWFNRMLLNGYMLEYKDRLAFWKQYVFDEAVSVDGILSVLFIDYGNCVCMDIKRDGLLYIFNKDFFEQFIQSQMREMNLAELRKYLKKISKDNQDMRMIRLRYVVGWKRRFDKQLKKRCVFNLAK